MLQVFVFGLFGALVGSFLNVVILRRGARSLSGRSGCLSCTVQLKWYDLVPVFSWLMLRGRCRSCGSRISLQYPLVEALTAVLFGLVGGAGLLPAYTALSLCIASLLIIIAAYDVRHTVIPDAWAYLFGALALFAALIAPAHPLLYVLLAGPSAALPLFALWLVSRGRWMGLGDAKLALGIGWLLGPVYGIYAVFFAFILGAVISVGILLPLPVLSGALRKAGIVRGRRQTSYTMKSEVPFGPFLIASCILIWFALLYHVPLPL